MENRVIYHDFGAQPLTHKPTGLLLTATVLEKGRHRIHTIATINVALYTACAALCGACTAVSIGILTMVLGG